MFYSRWLSVMFAMLAVPLPLWGQALPGTKLLEEKADFARVMVDGIGKYLDRETAASVEKRKAYWKPDYSSLEAYVKSANLNRERLKKIIGVVDRRLPPRLEYVETTDEPALVGKTKEYAVYAVRWPVLPGIDGEGLLLEPTGKTTGFVVAIPDADWTPEMLVGLAPGVPAEAQFPRALAESGCRVLVPRLIDRKDTWSGSDRVNRWTNQTHREFVYRMAYQMGRHIIGYEVQKILAAIDWSRQWDKEISIRIGIYGYGEGGLLALYSGALDDRIKVTCVSGYFGSRERLHEEPIYRNVWSLLRQFGDAELLRLIIPRSVILEHAPLDVKPPPPARAGRAGAAPGTASAPLLKLARNEIGRVMNTMPDRKAFPLKRVSELMSLGLMVDEKGIRVPKAPVVAATVSTFIEELGSPAKNATGGGAPTDARKGFDSALRQRRQVEQLVAYTQNLLPEAAAKRDDFFWKKLDTSSPDAFKKSQEPLRKYFAEEIIGELPKPTKPLNPRTRQIYDTPKFTGYEVVLDLYEDVICYGILLVPKDIKPGEKRPVVVCQHGLEGRPTDVCDPFKKTQYYNSFGAQLAERGFVVFAPQNPYIFKNDFRQLVRKANPLGLTLYAFIVQQHEPILDFLTSLPFVDASRIAYYGLSYGGKVAMRIPVLVGRYCVVICSGDFNEWIWKNITLDWVNSYMFGGEYEMYEFDLGNTFNYAEMAALIAPRPFMVERGHHDPVGLDEYVAFEYAKVRRFYARLGMPERTEIEWFNGGHVINGQATFAFLHRHLNFPAPK